MFVLQVLDSKERAKSVNQKPETNGKVTLYCAEVKIEPNSRLIPSFKHSVNKVLCCMTA